jgi:hypothetical protein
MLNNNTNEPFNETSGFSFNFHLDRFLEYNERRISKAWSNATEEKIIKDNEEMHAHFAQAKMPADIQLSTIT